MATEPRPIDVLRVQNRDQRLAGYQKELAACRAENARLRAALEKVVEATFQDAVNGHLLDAQVLTKEGIGDLYETARVALAGRAS